MCILEVKSVASALMLLAVACGNADEVGVLHGAPTPLFVGFSSYQTLAEITPSLPDRSGWQILSDTSREAMGECPSFSELKFAVEAQHHGFKGLLTLTLFNDRLATTAFAPDEWRPYLEALERTGIQFNGQNEAYAPPATVIWMFDRNKYASPFVGWRDSRFMSDVTQWESECS